MSWGNWQPPRPHLTVPGVISAPPIQSAVLPNPINAAPAIVPPVGMQQYSPDQWAQMQQQNWQQWAQWQQQYTQWHQQYGAEYQKSMGALPAINPLPSGGAPLPPPNENKPPPPPPPDDANRSGHYNTAAAGYNSGQNMGVPPPNWQNPNNKRPLLATPDHEANKRQMTEQWNRGMQPTQPQVAPNLEELSEAEKKFDKEFAAWEAQFNKWKDQNANHPDKTQYAEYEKKWDSWRNSLLDRREQMRKKRLAVQAAAKEAKPPVVVEPVKPPQNVFSKPPPTHNNEPLGFKPPTSNNYISQQQQENIGNDFLKSGSPSLGGIPGLDLVKDGNVDANYEDDVVEEPINETANPPVNKGPDFDAISKGINTILGDPKLLNILSRVSQNQNLAAANVASIPPQITPYQQQPQSNPHQLQPQSNPHQHQSNFQNNYQQQSRPTISPYPQQQYNPPQKQFNPPPQQQFNPPPQQQFNPPQQQSNPPSLLSMTVKPPPNMNNYDDYSEPNNFDDQTRTSFTNDQDMGYTNNSSNNGNYGKYNDRRSNRFEDSSSGQNNFRNSNNGPGFNNSNNYGSNNYNNRSYEDDSGYKQNDDYDEPQYDNREEAWQEDEEYDKYHDMYNEEQAVRENQPVNVLHESQGSNIMSETLNITPPEVEPPCDEYVPQLIIDYDHKPLKEPEPEVSLTITRMFDYRHKPVNRIPYPDRPIWLSSTLRNIQQFDPLGTSRFNSDLGYDRADRRNNQDYRYSRERFAPADNRMEWNDNSFNREKDFPHNRDNNRQTSSRTKAEIAKPLELEDLSDDDFNDDKNEENEAPLKFSPPPHKSVESPLTIEPPARMNSEKNNYSLNPARNNPENPPRHIFSKNPASRNTPENPAPNSKIFSQNTTLDELINPPGRYKRPNRIVIILRGPPGSGKTYLAKLIKDREVEHSGSAPRILSLDDYFMVEHERTVVEDGKFVRVKEMVYEYEEAMEEAYRLSLVKAFKKTITDGYFPFVVVDNINEKVKHFGEMWSFAKQNGFQVYICQLDLDPDLCIERNIHNRPESYIEDCIASWEPTPNHHPLLDPTSFLQSVSSIQEVEMEEADQDVQEETNEDAEQDLTVSANPYDHQGLWKSTSNWTTVQSGTNQRSQPNQERKEFAGPTWRNRNNRER
ncbi:unnamed protein product [Ceutorhynchus assimilis]|uniref:YLP motif-containing protein 1 n=1 Tax=Ceutorhynchus assimilis TaxID=467358 RepID=A0A9P0DL34_9CUCU|nr:unnamed protein product [Ceutorhynchus assimilis]